MATYRTKGQSQKLVYVHNPFKKGMYYTKTELTDGFAKIISNLDVSPAGDSAITRRAFQVYNPKEMHIDRPIIDIKTEYPIPTGDVELLTATIDEVIDGDTIKVTPDGATEQITIRLLGINAPEIGDNPEPWGEKAKVELASKLIVGQPITYMYEPDTHQTDNYDRHLCWVWNSEGLFVNAHMIYEAYAQVNFFGYDGGTYRYYNQFKTLEEQMMKTNLKIWGEKDEDFDYGEDNEIIPQFSSRYVYPLHYKYLHDKLAFIEVPESNAITEAEFASKHVGEKVEEFTNSLIKVHIKPYNGYTENKQMIYYSRDVYYPKGIIQFVKIDDAQPINPMLTNKIDYIHFAYIDYLDAYGFIGRILDADHKIIYKGLILMNYTENDTLEFYVEEEGTDINIVDAMGTGFNLYDSTPLNIENKQSSNFMIYGLIPLTTNSTIDNPVINMNPTPGQTIKIKPIYGLADIDYKHVLAGHKLGKVTVTIKHHYANVYRLVTYEYRSPPNSWIPTTSTPYTTLMYEDMELEDIVTKQITDVNTFTYDFFSNNSVYSLTFPNDKTYIYTPLGPNNPYGVEIGSKEINSSTKEVLYQHKYSYYVAVVTYFDNDNKIIGTQTLEQHLMVEAGNTSGEYVNYLTDNDKLFKIKGVPISCDFEYKRSVAVISESHVVGFSINITPSLPAEFPDDKKYLATKVERILPNGTVQVVQDLKVTGKLIKDTNDDYQIIDIDSDNPQINMFDFTRSGENYDSVRFTVYPVLGSPEDFVKNDLFYFTGVIPALGDKKSQSMITNKNILSGFDVRNATRLGVFTRQIYLYGPYTKNKFLQFSGFEKEWYYPYPYNTIQFEEKITHVHNHKDTLLVFGEHHMYLVYFIDNEDASASLLTSTKIYENLTINKADIRSVLSVGNNVIFFNKQSGYVLIPNKYTNDPTNITIARISDQVNNLVYNPIEYLEKRLNTTITGIESKYQTYVDDNTLVLCVSYLVNGETPVTTMYRYNMATRLWTMYDFTFAKEVIDIFIHEPQYYNQFIVKTDSGTKIMVLSNEWGKDCGEHSIECMINSGYIDCYGVIKDKRFRDLIFELNNISGLNFEFNCVFSVDGAHIIPDVLTIDYLDGNETNITLKGGNVLGQSFVTDESHLPPLDRMRVKLPVLGRGRIPSFTFKFVGDGALELLNYQIVFKEKNLNRRI